MFKILFCIILSLYVKESLANFKNIQTTTYDNIPENFSNGVDLSPFIKIGRKYYLIDAERKVSWFEAAHICSAHNGHLASIELPDELEALSNYLISKGYEKDNKKWFWLSGNDLFKEGSFHWLSTGKPFTSSEKWSGGQPDNAGGNENCVHLWNSGGSFHLNDWICLQPAYYICEIGQPKMISFIVW